MSTVKIVIIGAGSTEFTPGLLADIVTSTSLTDIEIALVDIVPEAVDTMSRLAQRMADRQGVALKISGSVDRRDVLPGAHFVTTTIAVGGALAWEQDVRIPERYGVYQTVGDSVGPGGVFRALRHVPVIAALAKDMEELCPDAWLFNYTNPMSAIVRGVHKTSSIKCVGLCHGVLHTRQVMARDLGVPASELNIVFAGVNHLCWLLDVRHDGKDMYPEFREFLKQGLATQEITDEKFEDPYDTFQYVSAMLTPIFGCFPSPGDRHVAEFFSQFLHMDNGRLAFGTQAGMDMTNEIFAEKVPTRDLLRAQAAGLEPLDDELFESAREGERLVQIIDAIVHDRPLHELAVNVRNDGLIANLPSHAVVEVPGYISGFGVRGISVGEIPEGIAGVLTSRINQQELTVDAALNGDRQLAIQALMTDPLMQHVSVQDVESMLDDAIAAHGESLAPFARHAVVV